MCLFKTGFVKTFKTAEISFNLQSVLKEKADPIKITRTFLYKAYQNPSLNLTDTK